MRQQSARPPPPRATATPSSSSAPPPISQQAWDSVATWDLGTFFSPTVTPGPLLRRIPPRVRLLVLDAVLIPLRRLAILPQDLAAHFLLLAFPHLVLRSSISPASQSATAACAAFARRFIQGDWLSLFNEAIAAAVPASRPHSLSSARSTATFARLNRAKRFAHCGDWSCSLAALEADELAPPTPETVTALKAKHPPATEELLDWLTDFLPSEVPQLTIPLLHQALRSAPRGTAAGLSGWLIEHLSDTFLSYQSHLPHLLRLFQNWLQGDLPQTVRPYFTASTRVALQKPQGGVRPIDIGEILPRLLSRCVTLHFKQQIRYFFLPSLQFGVAVSAGIEVMAHAVQSALSLHPEWVLLELDVANAFNSFSRSAMFNALRDSPFYSIIPFFRLFYASPSSLHYRSGPLIETLQSSSGVRQGDPCGPFLFALTQHLAIRPIQRQSPALFITSYADDTYMVGPAHDMFPAYTALTTRLNDLGLRIPSQPCRHSLSGISFLVTLCHHLSLTPGRRLSSLPTVASPSLPAVTLPSSSTSPPSPFPPSPLHCASILRRGERQCEGVCAHGSEHAEALAPIALAPSALAPSSLAPSALAPNALALSPLAPSALSPSSLAPSALAPSALALSALAPSVLAPNALAHSALAHSALVPSALAPSALAPSALAPSALAPSTMGPNALALRALAPSALAPNAQVPRVLAPSALAPSALAPSALAPSALAPSALSPSALAPNALALNALAPYALTLSMLAPSALALSALAPSALAPNPLAHSALALRALAPSALSPNAQAPNPQAPRAPAHIALAPIPLAGAYRANAYRARAYRARRLSRWLAPIALVPTALAPTALAPTALAPVALAPVALAPVALAPVALAPVSLAPVSLAPVALAPAAMAPIALAFNTLAPSMLVPVALAPATLSPNALAPIALAPIALAPIALAPIALAP
ncbi:unnamed protein product [Closterium sp. Naga37s-1]|nr:unnamed protein product [Closterium sp. Naga37s-1]